MTAQQVYDEVCIMLLEDGGLQYVYTEAAFLRDLHSCLVELCQETGFAVDLVAANTTNGSADVTIPATCMEVYDVLYRNRALRKGTLFDFGRDERLDSGEPPEEWAIDDNAPGTLTLDPPAISTGADATLIASTRPQAASYALADTLELIPDTVASYLKWMVLRKVWSTDGESKDNARAQYAIARTDEIKNLLGAILDEDFHSQA